MKYILHTHYICLARAAMVVDLLAFSIGGSFEPLTPEP